MNRARMWQAKGGKPKAQNQDNLRKRDTSQPMHMSSTQRLQVPDDEARNLPLRLSPRLDGIITGWHLIELYTEVGKARKYYNTPASNSRRNTDRHEALPVRYRMLFALPEPKEKGRWSGRRFRLATWTPPVPHHVTVNANPESTMVVSRLKAWM